MGELTRTIWAKLLMASNLVVVMNFLELNRICHQSLEFTHVFKSFDQIFKGNMKILSSPTFKLWNEH